MEGLYTIQFFDYRWGRKGDLTTDFVTQERLARMRNMHQTKIEITSVLDPDDKVIFESTGEGDYYN